MSPRGFGEFDFMFTVIPVIVVFGFVFIFGMIIYQLVSTARDKTKPIIPVRAKVIAKRTHVWGDNSRTNYYATFELENGQRIEFSIPDNKAGYIIEGDSGILSFQGNLFVKFERSNEML